jgi:hypothetical protein
MLGDAALLCGLDWGQEPPNVRLLSLPCTALCFPTRCRAGKTTERLDSRRVMPRLLFGFRLWILPGRVPTNVPGVRHIRSIHVGPTQPSVPTVPGAPGYPHPAGAGRGVDRNAFSAADNVRW